MQRTSEGTILSLATGVSPSTLPGGRPFWSCPRAMPWANEWRPFGAKDRRTNNLPKSGRLSCSPLPCTRGRGVGGEGACGKPPHGAAPSPPTPLPRVQGRGEKVWTAASGSCLCVGPKDSQTPAPKGRDLLAQGIALGHSTPALQQGLPRAPTGGRIEPDNT